MEDQDKTLDRNVRKDEDENEDVEAHSHKARNLRKDDEGDDVEGHMHKAAVNKGMHKA